MLLRTIALTIIANSLAATIQIPSRPELNSIANKSSAVVFGTVLKDKYWVTQPSKKAGSVKDLPNGQKQVELTNPADFVVGRILRVRVEQTFKKNAGIKRGDNISIFLPGWMRSDQAVLEPEMKYVIFLSPLQAENEQFLGTMLYQPEAPSRQMIQFNPKSAYIIVDGANGIVPITEKNRDIINEIKAILRASQ